MFEIYCNGKITENLQSRNENAVVYDILCVAL
jgi:hypothetical protein